MLAQIVLYFSLEFLILFFFFSAEVDYWLTLMKILCKICPHRVTSGKQTFVRQIFVFFIFWSFIVKCNRTGFQVLNITGKYVVRIYCSKKSGTIFIKMPKKYLLKHSLCSVSPILTGKIHRSIVNWKFS